MLRRDNRQERREERGPGGSAGGATHYQMRQKMFTIGDDFWIENDRGEKVYKVDGKALRDGVGQRQHGDRGSRR